MLTLGTGSGNAYYGDKGKTAYDHSQSAHAPSNAQPNQNAFSNVQVGNTTLSADSTTDTLNVSAYSDFFSIYGISSKDTLVFDVNDNMMDVMNDAKSIITNDPDQPFTTNNYSLGTEASSTTFKTKKSTTSIRRVVENFYGYLTDTVNNKDVVGGYITLNDIKICYGTFLVVNITGGLKNGCIFPIAFSDTPSLVICPWAAGPSQILDKAANSFGICDISSTEFQIRSYTFSGSSFDEGNLLCSYIAIGK